MEDKQDGEGTEGMWMRGETECGGMRGMAVIQGDEGEYPRGGEEMREGTERTNRGRRKDNENQQRRIMNRDINVFQ